MRQQEFTINLVSNASMATFPENTMAHFTTLLPHQLQLPGYWEVALVEIAWPSSIQNITTGLFGYRQRCNTEASIDDVPKSPVKRRKRTYGLVSMMPFPPASSRSNKTEFSEEHKAQIQHGLYSSIDSILQSICKKVFKTQPVPISWNIDPLSEVLHVRFNGKSEQGVVVQALSADLQSVLGLKTIIDCRPGSFESSPSRTLP